MSERRTHRATPGTGRRCACECSAVPALRRRDHVPAGSGAPPARPIEEARRWRGRRLRFQAEEVLPPEVMALVCLHVPEGGLLSVPSAAHVARHQRDREIRAAHALGVPVQKHDIEIQSKPVDFTQFTEPIVRFLHEVQRTYYKEMQSYLRGIGVKVPMTGSNWSRNLALLSSLQITDYTDSHSYFDHPKKSVEFDNRPMVSSVGNVFAALSFNRVLGKPFFVSEWDQPWPNEWRAEHPLAMAAVAAFQGWNGLTTYTYRHSASVPVEEISGSFETSIDPARFGLFYHAALLFRRGDVRPAEQTVAIYHPEEDILKSPNPTPWQMQEALLATAEQHQLAMALYESPDNVDKVISARERVIAEDATEVHSDTGELYRSWEKRIGVIDTPYTKAAYGFIGEVESTPMNGLNLHVRTPFATVAISSLTDEPIVQSSRLLLTAVGRAENTDFRYNILHTKKLDGGHAPILIEPIEATIELKTEFSSLKVWAIGQVGSRKRQYR